MSALNRAPFIIAGVSAPRQQLQAVERNLQLLESVLNQLEVRASLLQ